MSALQILGIACLLTIMPASADVARTTGPAGGTIRNKLVDPCTFASADTLQALLPAGIQKLFPIPIKHDGGYFEISSPSVEQVSCPYMSIQLHADVQYRQTRGPPQQMTSGSLVLGSPVIVDVEYSGIGAATTVTAANFIQAIAMVTDPRITSLKIEHIPSWLEPSWIQECLNGQSADCGCRDVIRQMRFNVTQVVQLYLKQGSTL